jgi:hypothetical protein
MDMAQEELQQPSERIQIRFPVFRKRGQYGGNDAPDEKIFHEFLLSILSLRFEELGKMGN